MHSNILNNIQTPLRWLELCFHTMLSQIDARRFDILAKFIACYELILTVFSFIVHYLTNNNGVLLFWLPFNLASSVPSYWCIYKHIHEHNFLRLTIEHEVYTNIGVRPSQLYSWPSRERLNVSIMDMIILAIKTGAKLNGESACVHNCNCNITNECIWSASPVSASANRPPTIYRALITCIIMVSLIWKKINNNKNWKTAISRWNNTYGRSFLHFFYNKY